MGWFDQQIKQRKLSDQEVFEDSFMKLASSVLGQSAGSRLTDSRYVSKAAIDDILKYYHKKPVEVSDLITDLEERLDHSLRPYGIMYRTVELKGEWYRDSIGPILAFKKEDKTPVALIPGMFWGYRYTDIESGRFVILNKKNAALFEEMAYCFYPPLPLKKLNIADLLLYLKNCISVFDIVLIAIIALIANLFSFLSPRLFSLLTGPVLESGNMQALYGIVIFMISAGISRKLIGIVESQVSSRLTMKASVFVEAAVMMRILSLPAPFFRKYSSGELTKRAQSVSMLCEMLMTGFLSGGISSIMSLMHVTQIKRFAPELLVPSLLIIFFTVLSGAITTLVQTSISRKKMEVSAKESGMSYALLSGIRKIRLSGSEKRAFAKWADLFAKSASYDFDPPAIIKMKDIISLSISLLGTIRLYQLAISSGMDQSSYFAFNSAYGMVQGAFSSFVGLAMKFASIRPILEMAEPILNEVPEAAEEKEVVDRISGNIEMSHVSFRYEEDGPDIINDLSLHIKAGEYVAIVGKTGCGKSTLIRLLLGFEVPQKGAIYYDNRDLKKIDPVSLRKKIGTVTQNGALFTGDIYSNISICAPGLTMDEAWEAAEMAGMANDIKAMPMGMFTMISEGARDISGGQKQRLMIARAVAPKPKVLIFDEATSALDNKTQKQVSEALDALKCTRIVIAHRLSTIRHCDRILFLGNGKILEEGTYDELIALNGEFASLVERQRLDKDDPKKKETDPE